MYDIIPYVCTLSFLICGLFMAFMPKQATKKEDRNSDAAIKKCRKNGIIMILISIVMALVCIF